MPSIPREGPLLLLRERPGLLVALLARTVGFARPAGTIARVPSADFTQSPGRCPSSDAPTSSSRWTPGIGT